MYTPIDFSTFCGIVAVVSVGAFAVCFFVQLLTNHFAEPPKPGIHSVMLSEVEAFSGREPAAKILSAVEGPYGRVKTARFRSQHLKRFEFPPRNLNVSPYH